MAIRQNIKYDTSEGKYYGRVDLRNRLDGDSMKCLKKHLYF